MAADELRMALAPWYLSIKALHVFSAMAWAWSTAVAWVYYLKPAFRRALANPDDAEARRRRDRFMEAFDRSAAIEHVAFTILIATGLVMFWVSVLSLMRWS